MSTYVIRGHTLYDKHRRRIAVANGSAIYDGDNRIVATIRGNELFDPNGSRMMRVEGEDIFDGGNTKVASLSDAVESIKGTTTDIMLVALWYCFIRQ